MLLKFTLNNGVLTLKNPEVLNDTSHFNYIQCEVHLTSEVFNHSDTLVAVFKSASYNVQEEVLLDILDGGSYAYGFIPGRVFAHGGVIQMYIYRQLNDVSNRYAHASTNVLSFYIDPSRYTPLRTSDIVQQLANEFQVIHNQITGMTVDWHEADELSVEKSIIDGGIHLEFGLVRGPQGATGDPGSPGAPGSPGPKGDPFTYADFTDAQLNDLKGEDGRGIASISKTGTSGLVDTYTITYTDGTTSTYTVTNGADGAGDISDVKVNGTSVVTNGIANIGLATTSAAGAMSAADKVKLNSITLTNGVIDGSCLPTYNGGIS